MEEKTGNPEPESITKNESHHGNRGRRRHRQPRPFLLTYLCIFGFIFYGLVSLMLFVLMFFSGWIADSDFRAKFLPDWIDSKQTIILVLIVAALLHLISFTGVVQMWYRRKSGYLLLSVSTLAIALFQLFTDRISVFTTMVYILLILFFGFYYRRFH